MTDWQTALAEHLDTDEGYADAMAAYGAEDANHLHFAVRLGCLRNDEIEQILDVLTSGERLARRQLWNQDGE